MINRAMLLKTKKVDELISALNTSGYNCKEAGGRIKVFIEAQGYQEFKMLVEEVLSIANKFGAQFLGYIG